MYFLKKLHKGPNVVRPIVSGNDGPTEKLSALLDHFLQPLVTSTYSYVRDSSDAGSTSASPPLQTEERESRLGWGWWGCRDA